MFAELRGGDVMEDKAFRLIGKLYNRMEEGFGELRSEIQDVRKEMKQDMARMEQKFADKISVLSDGLTADTEAIGL